MIFTKARKRPSQAPSLWPLTLLYFSSEHIIYWFIYLLIVGFLLLECKLLWIWDFICFVRMMPGTG